ncbi:LADA_0F13410g1_1 [Lachancea dasiensis]|uniref:LADA_0F13410g1_1 n=1 Tax=Lachancea dasiensis TaxID=1072105 RepID=A0A1G4JN62_9SACH|nr:LADA_0F13410g1_1 [Lachancea dasiensis]
MDGGGIFERPVTQDFLGYDLEQPEYTQRAHTLPANSSGVRQLVIKKQNGRVIAARSRLVDRMEDALVRWRPPASCHNGSTAAIEGKHPYQLEINSNSLCDEHGLSSMKTIRQRFESLSNAVIKSRGNEADQASKRNSGSVLQSINLEDSENTSHSSSASGLLQEIRESLQSPAALRSTPTAVLCETVPEERPVDPISYSFPIPTFYLPAQDVRPVGESTRDLDDENETGGYWTQLRQFWGELCRDLKAMCIYG